jgi:hypothetical protein
MLQRAFGSGSPGVRVFRATARFHYLFVVSVP